MSTDGSQHGDNDEVIAPSGPSLEELVENLSEKRSATREKALGDLIRQLQLNYLPQEIEERRVTLLENLKKSLKKGGANEKILASRLTSLVCITLGVNSEDVYNELNPVFREIISSTSTPAVRREVLGGLAIVTFVATEDEQITISVLQILSDIFSSSKYTSEEVAEALRLWALLVTSTSSHYAIGVLIPEHLSTLIQLLQSEDLEVRINAGEAIALLYSLGVDESEFDAEEFAQFGETTFDDLVDTLTFLSNDKTKEKGKREKAKQRIPFKDILSTIRDGETPSETLSILHQKFTFDTWRELNQLNALREVLAQGFQVHFERNDLLQEIFAIRLDREATKLSLSQVEKRLTISPSSDIAKARSRNMSKRRNETWKETNMNLEYM